MTETKDSAGSSDCGGAGAIIKAGLIISVLAVVTIVLHNKPPRNSGADNHKHLFCFAQRSVDFDGGRRRMSSPGCGVAGPGSHHAF